jgi:replicative DNA helicase
MTPDIGCLEAEVAVLGCLLHLSAAEGASLAETLQDEDFTDPRHRAVLQAARTCLDEGAPADPVTVLGELRRSGAERSFTADRSAGVFLTELLQACPSETMAGWYARIVVEHAVRRRVLEAAQRVVQVVGEGAFEVVTSLALAEWTAIVQQLDRVSPTARELIA